MDTSFDKLDPYKRKESPEAFTIMDAIEMAAKLCGEMDVHIKETYNAPNKLKEITQKTRRNINVLNRDIVKKWLEAHKWEKVEKVTYDVEQQTDNTGRSSENAKLEDLMAENAALREQVQRLEREKTEMSLLVREKQVEDLEGIDDLKKWQAIENKVWKKKVYSNTELKVGNPLATKDSVVKVVVVEPDDPGMERGVQKLYREKFPELVEIEMDFEVIEQITRIRSKTPNEGITRKIIKIKHDGSDNKLWEQIGKVKKETEGEEWIALHTINGMSPPRYRKMVESIFHKSETQVCIYTTKRANGESSSNDAREDRKQRSYAIVVEDKRKYYNMTVANIKRVLTTNEAKKAITGVRSTRDGKVLITLDKDNGALEDISGAISSMSEEVKVRKLGTSLGETETIHIRGMDAVTMKEEVIASLETKLGRQHGVDFRLSELRPNIQNTQAVTLVVKKEDARKILNDGRLRVGIVSCPVEKNIPMKRCYRCWAYDHVVSKKHCGSWVHGWGTTSSHLHPRRAKRCSW